MLDDCCENLLSWRKQFERGKLTSFGYGILWFFVLYEFSFTKLAHSALLKVVVQRTCLPINLSMQLMLDYFLYVHRYLISDLCFIFSGKPAVITFRAYSKDQIISILQQRFEVKKCVDCWWYLHLCMLSAQSMDAKSFLMVL